MKHIQKYYKVKIHIPLEFSANPNVAIIGERNYEDQAVPTVMKLIAKLTGKDVDEMILETDAEETHCPQQLFDVPVPQIADRIVEVVTAFQASESWNESLHRSSTCQDKMVEKIFQDSQSHAASGQRTGCKGCLTTRSRSELVNKS